MYFDGTFSFRNNFIMYFESNSSEKLILLSRASGKISSQLEKFDMLSISVWQFLFVYFSGIFFIAFLGILGKETGIRRLYVKILLKVFEVSIPVSSHLRLRFRTELLPDIVDVMMRLLQWGRVKIERAMKRKTSQEEQLAQLDLDAGGSSGDGNQIICREETLVLAPPVYSGMPATKNSLRLPNRVPVTGSAVPTERFVSYCHLYCLSERSLDYG